MSGSPDINVSPVISAKNREPVYKLPGMSLIMDPESQEGDDRSSVSNNSPDVRQSIFPNQNNRSEENPHGSSPKEKGNQLLSYIRNIDLSILDDIPPEHMCALNNVQDWLKKNDSARRHKSVQ